MTNSVVLKLCSVFTFIRRSFSLAIKQIIIDFLFKDFEGNYSITINNINLKITPNNDFSIKGGRFFELDSELYFFDTKNTEEVDYIKSQFLNGTLFPTNPPEPNQKIDNYAPSIKTS